ncbi:hypothetical protein D0Y65_028216 [Glycine soja]|uniref:Uncharacterized protein n=1 Tax=Glycine soja TaxID=3848 RepID=A0A445IT84_GLYSO|nr:hypothetical protein D0Y65_028216 [Glycine soja]
MQATSLCSHMFLSYPLPANLLQRSAPHKLFSDGTTTRRSLIYASKRDPFGHHYDGNLVDENMILLRMRIREIEMVEMKGKATSDWSVWEKKYFAENYGSDVCEAVGLLQRVLMNTRPSFALERIFVAGLQSPSATPSLSLAPTTVAISPITVASLSTIATSHLVTVFDHPSLPLSYTPSSHNHDFPFFN